VESSSSAWTTFVVKLPTGSPL